MSKIGHNRPPDTGKLEVAFEFARTAWGWTQAYKPGDNTDYFQDFTQPALHVLGAAALDVVSPGTDTELGRLCDQLRAELKDTVDPDVVGARLEILWHLDEVGVEAAFTGA